MEETKPNKREENRKQKIVLNQSHEKCKKEEQKGTFLTPKFAGMRHWGIFP